MAEESEEASRQGDLLADVEPEPSTGDAEAVSSPADEGVKDPKTPLEAVMAALEPGPDAPPTPESEVKDKDEPIAEAIEPEALDTKLPFAKHPRFRQLLAQNRESKAKAEGYESRLRELEPKAQHFDQLTQYAVSAGFTSKGFTDLLHWGRLMVNDPIEFHKAFAPHWARIEVMVGAQLPEDLQQKVSAGIVDEDTARELARKRGEAALTGSRMERLTQQTAQEKADAEKREQERQQTEFVTRISDSVSGWERQWKGSDPDYAKKQPRVMDRVFRKLQDKPPTSAEEALAICNEAKKEVDTEIRMLFPAKPGIRPNGSGTSVDTKGVPKTPLDAARMALESMDSR